MLVIQYLKELYFRFPRLGMQMYETNLLLQAINEKNIKKIEKKIGRQKGALKTLLIYNKLRMLRLILLYLFFQSIYRQISRLFKAFTLLFSE